MGNFNFILLFSFSFSLSLYLYLFIYILSNFFCYGFCFSFALNLYEIWSICKNKQVVFDIRFVFSPLFVYRRGQSPHSVTGSPTIHFMTASPKNPVPSISPLSSPPPQQQSEITTNSTTLHVTRKQCLTPIDTSNSQSPNQTVTQSQSATTVGQTTTLNLHGINLSSLQGAMATFPGLQNVQVCNPFRIAYYLLFISSINSIAIVLNLIRYKYPAIPSQFHYH